MTQEYQLETILAHAGINSDEATGALASPIHFSIAASVFSTVARVGFLVRV